MALPQLPLVRLELVLSPTVLILKNLLVPGQTIFNGEMYAIFMAFIAISATPGQNIVIFIDSQAAIKIAYLATIYSHQNWSSSANNLSTHFFAPEEKSFSNGSHLIAALKKMNKPTSCPKRLLRCIHLAFPMPLRNAKRLIRDKFRQKRISTLTDLGIGKPWSRLLDAKDVLSFLPYQGWRVWPVSESSPDMITSKPICLRLAWLIPHSVLSVNPGQ
ncbi:hypothetical protein TNCV_3019931 [Trichonephila clavipes]|nr:hypothetical protein TNCV_3019931 [Trichonephila clavipes]